MRALWSRYDDAVLAMALVMLTAFSFAWTPLRHSQDEWWHLKAGMLQVDKGLPAHGADPFSYCGEGRIWHNHEWLSQRWFYRVFEWGSRVGGFQGGIFALTTMKSVVIALTFGLVALGIRRRGVSWAMAALLAVVAADVSRRTFYARPGVFSFFLLAAYLVILHEWEAGRIRLRWLWTLPVATILWANLHGMVLLSVCVMGSYLLGAVVAAWKETLGSYGDRMRQLFANGTVRAFTVLFAATLVATLMQPSGFTLYSLAGKFTQDPLLKKSIVEMQPMPFMVQLAQDGSGRWKIVPDFVSFWLLAGFFAAYWLLGRGRRVSIADSVLALFCLYQALCHQRLLPLFAIAVVAPLAQMVWHHGTTGSRVLLHRHARWAIFAAAGVWSFVNVAVLVGETTKQTYLGRNWGMVRGRVIDTPMSYPMPVARVLTKVAMPGRLYTPNHYCGWFMWWLAPENYKLFADNRFDHFGSEFLRDELILRNALRPGVMIGNEPVEKTWQDVIRHWQMKTLVLERSTRLHARLRTSAEWRPVYVYIPPPDLGESVKPDDGWTVWITTAPEGDEAARAARNLFEAENPGAPSPESIENWKPDVNAGELPLPSRGN